MFNYHLHTEEQKDHNNKKLGLLGTMGFCLGAALISSAALKSPTAAYVWLAGAVACMLGLCCIKLRPIHENNNFEAGNDFSRAPGAGI